MSEFKLSSVLDRPLTEQHWPMLQTIIKALNEFVAQRAKNREYLDALKGKQKIIEANDQIKKRNKHQISQRQRQSLQQLSLKNEEQKIKLEKEWDVRRKKIEKEANELLQKKIEKYNLEKDKYLQQIQIALPLNNSPDRELYKLKNEQEKAVRCGDFNEAQRIKMQIMKRQNQLSKKYQKLRQSNIKSMMFEFDNKHNNQILLIQARRDEKVNQNEKLRTKKIKQLFDKHERELKQLIWVYSEQKKKLK